MIDAGVTRALLFEDRVTTVPEDPAGLARKTPTSSDVPPASVGGTMRFESVAGVTVSVPVTLVFPVVAVIVEAVFEFTGRVFTKKE